MCYECHHLGWGRGGVTDFKCWDLSLGINFPDSSQWKCKPEPFNVVIL